MLAVIRKPIGEANHAIYRNGREGRNETKALPRIAQRAQRNQSAKNWATKSVRFDTYSALRARP